MQLAGTLREPVALGEVSIEQGRMMFPFGSLDVNRGVIRLTRQNPHRPQVDFQGQGMNFGYNLGVNITGSADAPSIIFTSVPPLTTREIMLMLTAGEIPSGAYSYTDVDKASKLGYFLGKELISQLLGMEPGEDRLVFRTGEYVTDDGQLTYRIEYELLDWLAVFGEYTRFRDYNGGLKFNVYSR
jgi:translocation and assembly module TamB